MKLIRLILYTSLLFGNMVGVAATTFTYSGEVTNLTGVFDTLILPGAIITGEFDLTVPTGDFSDDPAIVNSSVLLLADPSLGHSYICFAFNTTCPFPFVEIPASRVEALELYFNANMEPDGGFIEQSFFSPVIHIDMTLHMDITNGTFAFTDLINGEISGVGNFEIQPVPLPGALWLFGSALLIFGAKQNGTALLKRTSSAA